jgi:hypothetical protein
VTVRLGTAAMRMTAMKRRGGYNWVKSGATLILRSPLKL